MKISFTVFIAGLFSVATVYGGTFTIKRRTESEQQEAGAHITYVSPVPGSDYVTPGSNIIIRSDENLDPGTIQNEIFDVVGNLSGRHEGKVVFTDDQRTVLFEPTEPFSLSETVNVSMTGPLLSVSGDTISLRPFSFAISASNLNADKVLVSRMQNYIMKNDGTTANSETPSPAVESGNTGGKNQLRRELQGLPANFPPLSVTKSDSASAGYIFLSTQNSRTDSSYGHYLMIADTQGTPVFYREFGSAGIDVGTDFTLQPTGVLSYAYPFVDPTWYLMNTSFQIIDSLRCGNGYIDDDHDMKILPNGNFILLADDYEQMDLSKVVAGGDTNATVLELVIQELDKNKNVIFQWRTLDHFNLTDGLGTKLTGSSVDPFHCNAIEMDPDGNILLSSRYLSEITKIDIGSGNIIWRLGGKNNQFDFVNDPIGFSYQHDIRRLPNGDITLMDNGNQHSPPFSRAIEYKLDEINKTATLVWQFRHSPDVYNSYTGSVQRLSDGNTLIGWGGALTPTITEARPDGSTALEMTFPFSAVISYRAYCFPLLLITSPGVNDTIQAGNVNTLRWKSSGVDSIDIAYSTNAGSSWSNLAVSYPAQADSLRFTAPAKAGPPLQFRIVHSALVNGFNTSMTYLSNSISVVSGSNGIGEHANAYSYSLSNNYPNPFNPSTIINFELPFNSHVTLKVYDALGREIETLVNETKGPGEYRATFDGSKLPSGVYFYRMEAGNYTSTKKALLIK